MDFLTSIPSTNKERNSAFEILRIIAIIFIIAHHFSVHGGFDFTDLGNSTLVLFNRTWINFIAQLGKVGVNLFVIISAYFLIDNNRFKTRKIISVILEMLTFSIVIGVSFWIINGKDFSLSLLKSIFLPFGSSTWWFMTSYLLLYLFSPLLNLGIRAMNKKMHAIFIVVLLVIWSLLPTFIYTGYGYSTFGWFIALYLIASFIKLYDVKLPFKPWVGIAISACTFVLWFLVKCGIRFVFDSDNYIVTHIIGWFNLVDMNNFVQVICTVLLFLSFKNIQMKNYNTINFVASTTLAIYLFHDHGDVRHYLWIELFKNSSYASSPYLFIYSIGVILIVFAAGVIIGLIYRFTLQVGYNKLLNMLERKWLYKIDAIFNERKSVNDETTI